MRNFIVTVNGNTYEVTVEDAGAAEKRPQAPQNVKHNTVPNDLTASKTPLTAPPKEPEKKEMPVASANDVVISSPMPGSILDIRVSVGDVVTVNQAVVILEAMKMENEIVTPVAGKVTAVHVEKGASVNSGALLISVAKQ